MFIGNTYKDVFYIYSSWFQVISIYRFFIFFVSFSYALLFTIVSLFSLPHTFCLFLAMLRFAQCWYHMHNSEICSFQSPHSLYNGQTSQRYRSLIWKINVKYKQTQLWVDMDLTTRHTAHDIVPWLNPKQRLMIHTFDLLMLIIKQSKHILMLI